MDIYHVDPAALLCGGQSSIIDQDGWHIVVGVVNLEFLEYQVDAVLGPDPTPIIADAGTSHAADVAGLRFDII